MKTLILAAMLTFCTLAYAEDDPRNYYYAFSYNIVMFVDNTVHVGPTQYGVASIHALEKNIIREISKNIPKKHEIYPNVIVNALDAVVIVPIYSNLTPIGKDSFERIKANKKVTVIEIGVK